MNKQLPAIQEPCCDSPAPSTPESTRGVAGSELLAALGDPTRLAILRLLAHTDDLCVCHITERFDLGQPTISHHLKLLRDAGLVSSYKEGKWVYYSLVKSKVVEARRILEDLLAPAMLPI